MHACHPTVTSHVLNSSPSPESFPCSAEEERERGGVARNHEKKKKKKKLRRKKLSSSSSDAKAVVAGADASQETVASLQRRVSCSPLFHRAPAVRIA